MPPSGPPSRAWLWWLLGLVGLLAVLCLGCVGIGAWRLASTVSDVMAEEEPVSTRQVPASSVLRVDRSLVLYGCTAVVGDGKRGRIYATTETEFVVLDPHGTVIARRPLGPLPDDSDGYTCLRLVEVDGDPEPEILAYTAYWPNLDVLQDDGSPCWHYEADPRVDDAWPADLDGDGKSEVVAAVFSSGVVALDDNGAPLWQDPSAANADSVCVGDANRDGTLDVVVASSNIITYDTTGVARNQYGLPSVSPELVRVPPSACAASLVAASTDAVGVAPDGRQLWSVDTGIEDGIWGSAMAESVPWLALAAADGAVVVVDAASGSVLASQSIADYVEGLSWYEDGSGSPLLLVATPEGITVCRVTPGPAPAPASH